MSSSGAGSGRTAPDFGPLAETYDRLRPRDEQWYELLELMVGVGDLAGRRVLDVGCGTGSVARALTERGSRVWGVDPSQEMLAVARDRVGRRGGLKLGRAEALPFKDAWFERVVLRLVVHLVDRARALPELARVLAPGGRAVIATFEPSHFAGFWLNRYFPSVQHIDAERFPAPEMLSQELEAAGFGPPRIERLTQEHALTRAEALERIRGGYISTLQLIPPEELEAGAERAEAGLPDVVTTELRWAVVGAERR
jgi:ubiquinone/menaquinone biosynthesis C-methylase UbiE